MVREYSCRHQTGFSTPTSPDTWEVASKCQSCHEEARMKSQNHSTEKSPEMLTLEYIRLLQAATLLVSLVLVLAVTFNAGTSDAAKIQQQERRIENLIPKHVPLGIKIRKEKEKDFKDLNNERWARDFELEVTNTGDKPIYAFYLLMFLDVNAAAGYQIVAPLYYGRDELDDLKGRPTPDDVPINPGESIICKIHPSQVEWWERARRQEHRPHPTSIQIKLEFLSFGDGTGLMGNDGVALPRKGQNQSKLNSCGPPSDSGRPTVLSLLKTTATSKPDRLS